mmetsp:Transcript_23769/g.51361  ORF Transcript_23769/g.51361 Transcript_23769/m.51361 type:complete len:119 (-) Transcript_23769:67-423(-)
MAATQGIQVSTKTGKTNASNDTEEMNDLQLQARRQDPFLSYSDPENVRRMLSFEPMGSNTDDVTSNEIQFVRKTRISFERNPTTLLLEDAEFCAELESATALTGTKSGKDERLFLKDE